MLYANKKAQAMPELFWLFGDIYGWQVSPEEPRIAYLKFSLRTRAIVLLINRIIRASFFPA